jgi:hypothetical protein
MEPRRAFPVLVALVAASSLCGAEARGQTISAGASLGWTGARNLEDGRGLDVQVQMGSFPLRLHVEVLGKNERGLGAPCGGFLPPGGCPQERIRDETRLWSAGLLWRFPVSAGPHWDLGVPVELMVGRIRGSTLGLDTGGRIEASGGLLGGGAGFDLGWMPVPAGPWSIRLRGGVRHAYSTENGVCADCYDPYRDGFSWAVLGLVLEYAWKE